MNTERERERTAAARARGFYVDTVGKNAKKIEEYIRNQLQEDLEYDQMSLKEYIDPFTGEPVNKSNKKK